MEANGICASLRRGCRLTAVWLAWRWPDWDWKGGQLRARQGRQRSPCLEMVAHPSTARRQSALVREHRSTFDGGSMQLTLFHKEITLWQHGHMRGSSRRSSRSR
jgi:hypothetical protein